MPETLQQKNTGRKESKEISKFSSSNQQCWLRL
jgi:hypothetical protein